MFENRESNNRVDTRECIAVSICSKTCPPFVVVTELLLDLGVFGVERKGK